MNRRLALLLTLLVAWSCARSTARRPRPPAAPEPAPHSVPAPAPAPPPVTPEEPLPTATLVEPEPELLDLPEVVRVGLATDLAQVTVPCCDAGVSLELPGKPLVVSSPVRIEPATAVVVTGVWRVQVAALKDEGQARGLAATLGRSSGAPADAVFDARTDLYKVRVGRLPDRPSAERLQTKLAGLGISASFVVNEGAGIGEAGFRVTQQGHTTRASGRWLAMRAAGEGGIRIEGRRYRGRILLYLNDRGLLNVIDEVTLEDYLRGVVPREMGPKVYNQLEALKAQAVAARTYAVRNLGEFTEEGYDICATPRCQVYGGMDDEEALTDQAIRETSGEVLVWDGRPADALYSSTCGGHTENVAEVFPLKHEEYLRAVPCLEAGLTRLPGALAAAARFPDGLMRRLLPPPAADSGPASLGDRLAQLGRLAGLAPTSDRLASPDRRELQRYLASLFDLAADARLFVAADDLPYLVERPPAGWTDDDARLAAYLVKSGLFAAPLDRPLAAGDEESLLLRLAVYLGVLDEQEVGFRGLDGRRLRVADANGERELELPAEIATFRELALPSSAPRAESGDLALVAGDRLRLYLRGDEAVGVVQVINREGVAYDRTSNRSSWTRFRSDVELSRLVKVRYPEIDFASFEILRRGASGRVSKIRVSGQNGQTVEVEGLAVRWTLDVPDTWFSAKRVAPKGKGPGWLFTGRGWGHGVGMCQVGAYGMAVRGHGYREILEHYYTGVEVAPSR